MSKEKKKSITKAEFLSKLSKKCDITTKQAGDFYSGLLDIIQEELKENKFVKMPDFVKLTAVKMPKVPEQKKFSHLHKKEIVIKSKPEHYRVKVGPLSGLQNLAPPVK